jgi:lipoprotein NlpI
MGPNQLPARPADAPKHNLIGRQLTQAGDYRGAIAEFNAVLRIAPDFARA